MKENCLGYGAPENLKDCMERARKRYQNETFTFRADCKKHTIVAASGKHFKLVGYDKMILWQGDDGATLDGSNVSDAGGVTGQYAVLCHDGSREAVAKVARTIKPPARPEKPQQARAKAVSMPSGGKAVGSIPKGFQGLWGDKKSCAASRRGDVGEDMAYDVKPRLFGNYFSMCEVRKVRQLSANKIAIYARCGEEGGLDEGDDGQRLVTMTRTNQRMTVRVQHMNPGASLPRELADQTWAIPACR